MSYGYDGRYETDPLKDVPDGELQRQLLTWKNGYPRNAELRRIADARAYGPHPEEPRISRGWPDARRGDFNLRPTQQWESTFVYGEDTIEFLDQDTPWPRRIHNRTIKPDSGENLSWGLTITQAVDEDWGLSDTAPYLHVFCTGGTCRQIMESAWFLIDQAEDELLDEMRKNARPEVMYGLA